MAKLPAVVDALDAVPEPARGFYQEVDGRFVLDADVRAHPETAALKSALDKERSGHKEKGGRVTALEQEIHELKARIEAAGGERGGERGGSDRPDLEKLLKKREQELRAEYEPVVKERDTLRATLTARERRGLIETAARKAKIMPDRFEDALLAADRFIEVKDGKAVVLDAEGDPTGMSLDKFFGEWFREQKPWLYEGAGGSGSGAKPGAGGGAGAIRLSKTDAKNPVLYRAARERAQKEGRPLEVES